MRKVLFALACAGLAAAQSYVSGPQVLTFLSDVDDSDQPYGLYLPKNFDPARKYPLVISLHGAWSNHRLNLKRVFGKGNLPGEDDATASRYFPPFRDVEFIVASPYARGTMGYQGIPEKDVYDVMDDVKKRFRIDEDRVYLTGLSMGGGGTLWLAGTRPDIWAAIAPVCPALPAGAEDLLPSLLNVPVHLFHGDQDPAVPVKVSRDVQKKLVELGSKVEYIEYPGVKHNSWDNAYKDGAIFDWFGKFRRNPYPETVRFVTKQYKYNSAYWVQIDSLTPGTTASIEAVFTAPNSIGIKAEGLQGFTLKLAGHPGFDRRKAVTVTINGTKLAVKPAAALSFRNSGDRWSEGSAAAGPGEKRPGAEGPVSEAVASRHIYVSGTLGADKEQESARREQAARAAEWSTPQLRLFLSHRVASDKQVTDADLRSANLVLFGTKETNALIASLAERLPLELSAGAADYGLVFVAPVDGRYVVVSSGLPWWTGQETANRPGLRFLRAPYTVLLTMGDYLLFKGSLANVIAEGRFDASWKVPPPEREKIQATGVVTIR